MKKIALLTLLFSTMIFAQEENQIPLTNPVRFNHHCFVGGDATAPCIKVDEGNIRYTLTFDEKEPVDINKPLKIQRKSTKSENFKTPEGYTIENTYADVKKYGKLKNYPGWEYYVELPSGWCAAFFNINEPTSPKETDKITFFFKRYE